MSELMIKKIERVKTQEITLRFTGLLNYAIYNKCEHSDIEKFIENDVKVRLENWLNEHFKEDPFCGTVNIKSIYSVIDYSYSILEEVESVIMADVNHNVITDIYIVKTEYATI